MGRIRSVSLVLVVVGLVAVGCTTAPPVPPFSGAPWPDAQCETSGLLVDGRAMDLAPGLADLPRLTADGSYLWVQGVDGGQRFDLGAGVRCRLPGGRGLALSQNGRWYVHEPSGCDPTSCDAWELHDLWSGDLVDSSATFTPSNLPAAAEVFNVSDDGRYLTLLFFEPGGDLAVDYWTADRVLGEAAMVVTNQEGPAAVADVGRFATLDYFGESVAAWDRDGTMLHRQGPGDPVGLSMSPNGRFAIGNTSGDLDEAPVRTFVDLAAGTSSEWDWEPWQVAVDLTMGRALRPGADGTPLSDDGTRMVATRYRRSSSMQCEPEIALERVHPATGAVVSSTVLDDTLLPNCVNLTSLLTDHALIAIDGSASLDRVLLVSFPGPDGSLKIAVVSNSI